MSHAVPAGLLAHPGQAAGPRAQTGRGDDGEGGAWSVPVFITHVSLLSRAAYVHIPSAVVAAVVASVEAVPYFVVWSGLRVWLFQQIDRRVFAKRSLLSTPSTFKKGYAHSFGREPRRPITLPAYATKRFVNVRAVVVAIDES